MLISVAVDNNDYSAGGMSTHILTRMIAVMCMCVSMTTAKLGKLISHLAVAEWVKYFSCSQTVKTL